MVGKVASVSCEPCVFYSAIAVLTVNSSYTLCPPPLLPSFHHLNLIDILTSLLFFSLVFLYSPQVEQFWSFYSFFVRPGELSGHSDIHLFKTGIKPMWEVCLHIAAHITVWIIHPCFCNTCGRCVQAQQLTSVWIIRPCFCNACEVHLHILYCSSSHRSLDNPSLFLQHRQYFL